jgi:hypothetical protein
MKDRVHDLRQRLAYYRRRLEEGVEPELAKQYLEEIVGLEAEMRRIDSKGQAPTTRATEK